MASEAVIQIDRPEVETIHVPIVGTSPLIVNRFSEKAKREMLENAQGMKRPKAPKDPKAEYAAAFYRIASTDGKERYGFPVTAFKAATIGAARFYGKSVTMAGLRQFLFIRGLLTDSDTQQLVEIEGEPRMREDAVRFGGRSTDLRYRPEFREWKAVLDVTYAKSAISQASVLSLIDAGGTFVGVGEWRPEKHGEFGTYVIDGSREIKIEV